METCRVGGSSEIESALLPPLRPAAALPASATVVHVETHQRCLDQHDPWRGHYCRPHGHAAERSTAQSVGVVGDVRADDRILNYDVRAFEVIAGVARRTPACTIASSAFERGSWRR